MAPQNDPTTITPDYLDGVITTDLNLFACRVPDSESTPRPFGTADRMMELTKHDPEAAFRLALSRALEEAGHPLGRHAENYLQAALIIAHSYGHPTHRKA